MDEFADCWSEPGIRLPWLHLSSLGAVLSTAIGEVLAFWPADSG